MEYDKELKELKECTFRPKINDFKSKRDKSNEPKGFYKEVERVRKQQTVTKPPVLPLRSLMKVRNDKRVTIWEVMDIFWLFEDFKFCWILQDQ